MDLVCCIVETVACFFFSMKSEWFNLNLWVATFQGFPSEVRGAITLCLLHLCTHNPDFRSHFSLVASEIFRTGHAQIGETNSIR